jgi:hypothetical protein
MEKKIPGEGKTYKALPDGRVMFRSPYADHVTVVLTAEEYARIEKLRLLELMLSLPTALPVVPVLALTGEGKVAIVTTATVLLVLGSLSLLVHVYFKRRQQVILQRAPISSEQLPGFGMRDYWTLVRRTSVPTHVAKHSLRYLVIGFLGGWSLVFGKFFGAEFATEPKAPSVVLSAVIAIASTAGLCISWRRRRRNGKDVSS